jgi:hypothetical protein
MAAAIHRHQFVALSVLVVWGRVYKLPITPRPGPVLPFDHSNQ